jgi:hypothetical protein
MTSVALAKAVVNDQNQVLVRGPNPDAFAGLDSEIACPASRARPEFISIEICEAHQERDGAEAIFGDPPK